MKLPNQQRLATVTTLHAQSSMTLVYCIIVLLFCSGRPVFAEDPFDSNRATVTAKASEDKNTTDAGLTLDKILTRIVLDNIPHNYADNKKWGMQEERWDGIEWRRNGWKIEAERRRKMVNHGTWQKYSAELIDPRSEFTVQAKNLHRTSDEKLGFDVHCAARLRLHGRHSKWIKGVQLYSVSADGEAKVRLVVSCQTATTIDISNFPPDVVFVPTVTAADLVVDEFRLHRISKVGGEFAQQVTRGARSILDEKIDEKERKLVERLNRELEKEKDALRLSISDAIKSRWADAAKPHLPSHVRQEIEFGKKTGERTNSRSRIR